MKTGQCKFGERCKFHHPIDRSAPNASVAQVQPNVKLTLAGLPRREVRYHGLHNKFVLIIMLGFLFCRRGLLLIYFIQICGFNIIYFVCSLYIL